MLIKDPLIFPEKLFPLTVQGLVHDSKEYVWFNLPTLDKISAHSLELKHVGNMYRPPSEWRVAATMGTFVGTTATWMGAVGAAASITAAPPLAILLSLTTGVAGMAGVVKATTYVDEMFEERPPRVLGQQCTDGGDDGEDNNNRPLSAEDFTVQPGTHTVSSRRGRDCEDRRRRHRR